MSMGSKPTLFKGILLFGLFLLMAANVFSYIQANGSANGYNESDPDDNIESLYNNSEIEKYIEEGGGHFLRSYRNIMYFSELVELSNLEGDQYELKQKAIDEALVNIQLAIGSYDKLIELAESTPYNWRVIYQLWFFNYDGFCRYYNLNATIFREVRSYLSSGDITGYYKLCRYRLYQIKDLLKIVRDNMYSLDHTTLKYIWELNELCTRTLTTGQYVARVFYSLENGSF